MGRRKGRISAEAERQREKRAPSAEALTCWQSFETFLETIRPRMRSIATSHRVPVRDAEDLMQEALLTLVAKSDKISSPTAWVVATFTLQCRNYWRRRRRERSPDLPWELDDPDRWEGSLGEVQEGREPWMSWDVGRALGTLSEGMRRVVWLRHAAGCSSREVAERTGYAKESVRQIHGRALRKLRRYFGVQLEEE